MARREEITVWSWEHTAIVLLTLIAITSICIGICMYGGQALSDLRADNLRALYLDSLRKCR